MDDASPPAAQRAPAERVPRSFRRESRLFLWIALLLILFVNVVTLVFFRSAVAWGEMAAERRAGELLRRVSLPSEGALAADPLDRAALEPDVLFAGVYDARGRRLRSAGAGLEAPPALAPRPATTGRPRYEWRVRPPLLLASLSAGDRTYLVALTGYGRPEDRDRALAAGFDDFIVKPLDQAALERVLRKPAGEGADERSEQRAS